MRADLFEHTLRQLAYGNTLERLSERLNECLVQSRLTGKMSELTLTLKMKPKSAGSQVFITEAIKAKVPEFDAEESILFAVDLADGTVDLQRTDPRQDSIPGMRVAEDPRPKAFRQAGEAS
jgi:hypothetical protein